MMNGNWLLVWGLDIFPLFFVCVCIQDFSYESQIVFVFFQVFFLLFWNLPLFSSFRNCYTWWIRLLVLLLGMFPAEKGVHHFLQLYFCALFTHSSLGAVCLLKVGPSGICRVKCSGRCPKHFSSRWSFVLSFFRTKLATISQNFVPSVFKMS